MRGAPVLFIASRFLIGRKDESGSRDQARKALAGAILSVALSLVPLITVMQVADGMIQGISARYIELGTYHAQAWPYASSDLNGARDAARAAPEVTGAWIETQSAGIVFAHGAREGAAIRGVESGFLDDTATRDYLRVVSGMVAIENPYDAVIGQAMAEKLALKPGDQINLISIRKNSNGSLLPRIHIFTVQGIVSAGYRDLDAQWLFIRQDTATRILPKENTRNFIGIKSSNPFQNPLRAVHAVAGRLPPGFSVYSWREVERNLFESLASTRTMLLLIMAVTVAVAAVNVSSALTTLVLERGQEIAVLKSCGAKPHQIARIFSLGGAIIGGMGAVLGIAGGLLTSIRINDLLSIIENTQNCLRLFFARLSGESAPAVQRLLDPAYYLERIPVDVSYSELIVVLVATVVLSYVAAIGPASKAANLSPLDGFRKR
jgi:lipoprotein-releasing system permease protein